MSLESWNPEQRFDAFRRKTSEMLDELLSNLTNSTDQTKSVAFHPEVDLVETNDEFRFYVSIPGMIEDDLWIDIDGRHLTIRGERVPPYDSKLRGTAIREWRYGSFERHFELPTLISVTSIRASYDAGVLTIVAEKLAPNQTSGLEGAGWEPGEFEVRP